MPSIIHVQLNKGAVGDFLKSEEVAADLLRRGEKIAAAAGDGYEAEVLMSHDRASVIVWTATPEARLEEALNHNLLRAIQSGAD